VRGVTPERAAYSMARAASILNKRPATFHGLLVETIQPQEAR